MVNVKRFWIDHYIDFCHFLVVIPVINIAGQENPLSVVSDREGILHLIGAFLFVLSVITSVSK